MKLEAVDYPGIRGQFYWDATKETEKKKTVKTVLRRKAQICAMDDGMDACWWVALTYKKQNVDFSRQRPRRPAHHTYMSDHIWLGTISRLPNKGTGSGCIQDLRKGDK